MIIIIKLSVHLSYLYSVSWNYIHVSEDLFVKFFLLLLFKSTISPVCNSSKFRAETFKMYLILFFVNTPKSISAVTHNCINVPDEPEYKFS